MAPCRGLLRFLNGSDLDSDKEWSEIVNKLTSQELKLNVYDENGLVSIKRMRLREPKQLSLNAWSIGADIKNPVGSTEKANVTLIRRIKYNGPIWTDSRKRLQRNGFELHGDSDSTRFRVESQVGPRYRYNSDKDGVVADGSIIHKNTNKSSYIALVDDKENRLW